MRSLRLSKIASLVSYDTVFDVGADHGELEKILSLCDNIKKIYAVENKKGPFLNLSHNVEGLTKVTSLLSNGIKDLKEDVNSLVIAGMGGINIVEILLENEDKLQNVKEIILEPHSDYELVRRILVVLDYKIDEEIKVTEAGKNYLITRFIKGKTTYSNDVYRYGLHYNEESNNLDELKVINKRVKSTLIEKKLKELENHEN